MTKVKKRTWRDELNDYPGYYDAHKDGLSDAWDRAESVNTLLKALREAEAEIEIALGMLRESKAALQCHARQDTKDLRQRMTVLLNATVRR